ncbi:Membrane proteins related to metalloendopeptidases [Streptomyces sp. LamerLS-316]|uniref:M23 family metallopeptidase n=1 Tax=unclassified Streptomyces TaxID=2593676 RepID=UPI000823CC43|nr:MULTISPECIES: M23 family metallopeptidase [unclassified Streptomyces]MYQ41595.1 peptidoglycan DD-metalloendopeptidase family protein [Streptomyces sp. SID4921]SCK26968.1 Membrane proteins related to metalloendopeptidases [Streptomyces sp. LamerLS-316]
MSARRLPALLTRVFLLAFFALVVTGLFVAYPFPSWLVFLPLVLAWVAGIAGGRLASRDLKAARRDAVEVLPPVTGRWSAINSPADRVPSHGVHTYGQTYAIDIVAEGTEKAEGVEGAAERPPFAWLWPLARRPEAFPAFGAPLFAVADAKVVTADDTQRDHLSRNSLLGLAYLLLAEGELRGLAGAHRVFGNRVVLDLGDGTYAAYAHVRRGSLQVRAGDTVRAGQRIARCGNSGNSTEPHVHFQLMDHPDLDRARGIPFRWRGVGVPANGEAFTAGDAVRPG